MKSVNRLMVPVFALLVFSACGGQDPALGVTSSAITTSCSGATDAIRLNDGASFGGSHSITFCGVGTADLTQYCRYYSSACLGYCCSWSKNVKSWKILTGTGTDYMTGEFDRTGDRHTLPCTETFNSDSGVHNNSSTCVATSDTLQIISDQ